jgi:hypothetical protein
MGEFVGQVLKGTPVWVWAILAALVVLGVRQLKPRVVPRYSVLIAPVVFLFVGLMASGRAPLGFLVWALSLLSASAFTFFVWKPSGRGRYDASSDRLHLPGSVIPLLLMLSIFLLNYVINVAMAVNPAWRTLVAWQVGPAIVLGLLSGVFMGRSLTQFRLNRGNASIVAAH